MASIQQSFLDFIRPRLRNAPTETPAGVGLSDLKLGLLSVQPLDAISARGQSDDQMICSVSVAQASFAAAQQLDHEPLMVETSLQTEFLFKPGVPQAQDKRDLIYGLFLRMHGFAGRFSDADPYNIMALNVTGFAQGITEGTNIWIDSYAVRVLHHEIAPRGAL